jgi:pectate lyase
MAILPLPDKLPAILFTLLLLSFTQIGYTQPGNRVENSRYLKVVRVYADSVITNGRDTYGEIQSPLFADGINVLTGDPVKWTGNGETWILSNYGSQQNLMRVLDSLTELTGDETYREAAAEATRYMFTHHSDSRGLLYWGGHKFVDLATHTHHFEDEPHELKNNFPYYEFMWRVDPDATARMLRAIWNAHILDWKTLDMNRHGPYNSPRGVLWDHDFEQPEPFFEGRGLTFINFGTDMMHVGFSLYILGEDDGARLWSKRLFEQYIRARHPETKLGVYQYSMPERRDTPPASGPLTGRLTYSNFGDRAENQFREVYGDIALEGNVLWGNRVETMYGRSPIMTLHLAEKLEGTPEGDYLLEKTLEGLIAMSHHAYDAEKNIFRPMWTDGTDLTGHTMPRTGYYGREGDEFRALKPDGIMALSYARAARLSGGEPAIWNVLRNILIAEGLGDIGSPPVSGSTSDLNLNLNQYPNQKQNQNTETDSGPDLDLENSSTDPNMLVAVLELYMATENPVFLQLAERMGDNIITRNYHHGYFMPSRDHLYARFDSLEPLALLVLEAIRSGTPDAVPPYLASYGSTQGAHDDYARTIRDWIFYEQKQ